MAIKTRMIPEKYVVCDFCGKEASKPDPNLDGGACDLCGKDCCHKHIGQWEEDGILCVNCAKTHEIRYGRDGGVGIANKKTGKYVKW